MIPAAASITPPNTKKMVVSWPELTELEPEDEPPEDEPPDDEPPFDEPPFDEPPFDEPPSEPPFDEEPPGAVDLDLSHLGDLPDSLIAFSISS